MGILTKLKDAFLNNDAFQYSNIIDDSRQEHLKKDNYFWGIKINEHEAYKSLVSTWPDKKRIDFLVWCVEEIPKAYPASDTYSSNEVWYQQNCIREAYINQILKTKLDIDNDDLENILKAFSTAKSRYAAGIMQWPVAILINQLKRQYKEEPLSEKMIITLKQLKETLANTSDHRGKERALLCEKIETLVFGTTNKDEVKPTLFLGEDRFTAHANPHG
jgi:hypothetical protein